MRRKSNFLANIEKLSFPHREFYWGVNLQQRTNAAVMNRLNKRKADGEILKRRVCMAKIKAGIKRDLQNTEIGVS